MTFLDWFRKKPAVITTEHWAKASSYPETWGERAGLAGRHIAPGSRVLDIGCGRMQLRDKLPAGCTYTPADMTRWSEEVHQVDLDRHEFPPGTYDVITLLGVLEYLQDPAWAVQRAAQSSTHLVTTYCHPLPDTDMERRRNNGWINALSPDDLKRMLAQGGWRLGHDETFQESSKFFQRLYVCVRQGETA